MLVFWRNLFRTSIFLWIGYIALTQPGLPACWLEAHACEIHVHFSVHQAEIPHSHDYLLDLTKAQGASVLPSLLIPAGFLIALLFGSRIFRQVVFPLIENFFWNTLPDLPPPRLALSS
jgi:hypothetical protein